MIHNLRYTLASHLAINGMPIFTIQKLTNHKDKMSLQYAKLSCGNEKEAVIGLVL